MDYIHSNGNVWEKQSQWIISPFTGIDNIIMELDFIYRLTSVNLYEMLLLPVLKETESSHWKDMSF